MKQEHINECLAILAKSNSVKFSMNVPVTDNYSNKHDILIHECNAALIADLIKAGFKLSMCSKGLDIARY